MVNGITTLSLRRAAAALFRRYAFAAINNELGTNHNCHTTGAAATRCRCLMPRLFLMPMPLLLYFFFFFRHFRCYDSACADMLIFSPLRFDAADYFSIF